MTLALLAALALFSAPAGTPVRSALAPGLAADVAAIVSADYRGDRAALQRLARSVEGAKGAPLAALRHYWAGFALWRRALNGFNETPVPGDLEGDLRAGLVQFRAALAARPGWVEAKIGIVGCSGSLLFLTRDAPASVRTEIVAEIVPLMKELETQAGDNPRALWLIGGARLSAPPPYGGDPARALVALQQGVQAAIAEGRAAGARAPLEPRWGGPENLMSLAWVYSRGALASPRVAEAYAQGALVAVPEWHYVRDVLLPQIVLAREEGR